jgi:hypothetical protein
MYLWGSDMEEYTIANFNGDFPDDAACLEWLKNYLYPEGRFRLGFISLL